MKKTKLLALLLATVISAGALSACGGGDNGSTASGGTTGNDSKTGTSAPDTSKEVNLVYYLFGGEGVACKDILAEINKKMKADINATVEVKYIDWGDIATKYPLLFASGEQFDMAHASPGAEISYYTLAQQDALTDITTMLDTAAPKLKAEIPEKTWAGSKYNGKIYGVPSLYSEFTPHGFVYRKDLQKEYGVADVTSFETMEAYLDKALETGKHIPMNMGAGDAVSLFRMFLGTTGSWIAAPGIPESNIFLAAESTEKYTEVFHPAFTDEFAEFCKLMREWADKGYWSKDVMSGKEGGKANTTNNLSAGYITHMPDWTGNYGAMEDKLPGVETGFWCFEADNNKIIRKMGVENSTVISSNSKNPERALMAIEKFMTDESYYRLIQYGIEGRQYEIQDGVAVKPAGFDPEVDGGGFSAWSLRTDRLNVPYKSEDPRRYELNKEWDKVALDNSYLGFSFDSKPVSTEVASITNVNANLGIQLLFGKTKDDVDTALKQYREQLKSAGVDKVVEEVKTQLGNFTPVGK